MIKIPKEIKVQLRQQAYYERAIHYYVLSRHSFSCKFFPLSGNLAHHSIEMLLHAGLAKKHGFVTLKKRYSKHDLFSMWTEFKNVYSAIKLNKYDKFISKYNKWRDLRYPKEGKSNTVMIFDIRKNRNSKVTYPKYKKDDEYRLNLEEIDEFFKEISLLTGINPQFVKTALFSKEAKESYEKDNYHKLWDS